MQFELLLDIKIDIFINLRCDSFLLQLPDALDDAKSRVKSYEKLKVDGLFFPRMSEINDIKVLTQLTKLPINVMYALDLPNFETLKALNIKRISMGNFFNKHIYAQLEKSAELFIKQL